MSFTFDFTANVPTGAGSVAAVAQSLADTIVAAAPSHGVNALLQKLGEFEAAINDVYPR